MADDDDLRFGDVGSEDGSSGTGSGIVDRLTEAFVALIILYVILKSVEILLDISIPLI